MAAAAGKPLGSVLRGRWRLQRRIVGAGGVAMGTVLEGAEARFEDETSDDVAALLQREGERLLYREQGQLALPQGRVLSFHREYLYLCTSATSADVFFFKPALPDEHLKFFHSVSLGAQGESCAEHLCVQDLYKVAMKLTGDSALDLHWRVTGPAKDYEIFTHLDRIE